MWGKEDPGRFEEDWASPRYSFAPDGAAPAVRVIPHSVVAHSPSGSSAVSQSSTRAIAGEKRDAIRGRSRFGG